MSEISNHAQTRLHTFGCVMNLKGMEVWNKIAAGFKLSSIQYSINDIALLGNLNVKKGQSMILYGNAVKKPEPIQASNKESKKTLPIKKEVGNNDKKLSVAKTAQVMINGVKKTPVNNQKKQPNANNRLLTPNRNNNNDNNTVERVANERQERIRARTARTLAQRREAGN